MNLSMHRATPHHTLANQVVGSISIFHVIANYLPLMNKELEDNYGVEVDLHIAGSAALRSVLKYHSRFSTRRDAAYQMPVGDIDFFIGIRKIRDCQGNRDLEDAGIATRVRGSRSFNNLIHLLGGQGSYINSMASNNGSESQSGVIHAYQLAPMSLTTPTVIPRFNIIFREGMYNSTMSQNIEGLFNSFDLDVLECCITLTNSRRASTRNITTWTSDFQEALEQGIAVSKRPLEGPRLEKYTGYLQHLGIQSDWGLQ